ncbi:VOC family protein [Vibrio crassostreae]|uniref:VOC family protein n=1 Tax=Vibrio crassostreae TaxID=246167 RepID=UPI001B309064|nr:VOC family protein [Vibrio crassostreae]
MNTLPGLKGIDHFGLTVPSLDEAVDFFVNIIGCEPFYELGPFQASEWLATTLGVTEDTTMKKLKFLRCANGTNLELFEYECDDKNLQVPKNSDIGGHHLAFYVVDFDKAITFLVKNNIEILGVPTVRTHGPSAGQTWVYFKAPWGLQLELVSFPNGKGYEKDYDNKLWHPAFPSE